MHRPDGKKKGLFKLVSALGFNHLWRVMNPYRIPVLGFHGVLPEEKSRLFNATGKFISTDGLRLLLERLTRIYRVIHLDDFVKALIEGHALKNVLVLTFDDGYMSTFTHAFPLLKEMGIPFTIFVTTGYVDSSRVLWNDLLELGVFSTRKSVLPRGILKNDLPLECEHDRCEAILSLKPVLKRKSLKEAVDQVRLLCDNLEVACDGPELDSARFLKSDQIRAMADQGVGFGGHSVTHPILSRETQERVRSEVSECKRHLESLTGEPITVFAYPNGQRADFNDLVKRELRDAGYLAAFTGIPGVSRPGMDMFEVNRLLVSSRWTYEEVETRISGIFGVLGR